MEALLLVLAVTGQQVMEGNGPPTIQVTISGLGAAGFNGTHTLMNRAKPTDDFVDEVNYTKTIAPARCLSVTVFRYRAGRPIAIVCQASGVQGYGCWRYNTGQTSALSSFPSVSVPWYRSDIDLPPASCSVGP